MNLPKQILLSKQKSYQKLLYFLRNHVSSHADYVPSKIIFENTLNLPCQPVPKLSQTIDKYLKSVTPFLNESELKNTEKKLKQFGSENGTGQKLQKLLEEKAKTTENWLADWWINVAYLEYRDPVTVYSSPGLVFPPEDFKDESQRLSYTAQLILAAVSYKLDIYSDKLPIDKMGKDPLDMNQYKKIFGTCRIPGEKRDTLDYNPKSRHIVVARNNNFFKVEVINCDGATPSMNQLINHLKVICRGSQDVGPAIGVLSSENRDNWYKAYEQLIKDLLNRRSVCDIQESLFLVALDNPMPEFTDSPRVLGSKQCIHGGGSRGNSANRWFDKTIQFCIGQDGVVGLTYEHSPSEGQPIAVMTDFLVNYIKKGTAKSLPETKQGHCPEKLTFNVCNTLEKYIQCANNAVDKLAYNLDIDAFQFTLYGKDFIKKQKLSPDSFLQIAMQYAFFRIHKVPGAHYESAALRKYIHGRTETIRSCSIESIEFARTMLEEGSSNDVKIKALKDAVESHKKYSVEAVSGFGVDRHLLGLKLIANENSIELPDIYKDPSYTRSSHMRLSTSQVATQCDGFMAYAPLTPDGYGCCYNPRPNDINFAVSAFEEHPDTSAAQFRQALECSLQEMQDIFLKAQKCKL